MITKYKEFNNIEEDKVYKFSEYEPTKYNGNIVIDQIMEWLRAKLLDTPGDEIKVPLDTFFQECAVDKNKFMTFYNHSDRIKNFSINIEDDFIIFGDFKNNEEKE